MTAESIRTFIRQEQWIVGDVDVRFLAAGEYNENYLLTTATDRLLFRINHGTQLGLRDQITYEFRVLEAVYPSGVTPRPLRVRSRDPAFPNGAMMMEFIPGIPLDYDRDWCEAARLLAAIHRLPAVGGLLRQASPVADLVRESRGLLRRYPDQSGRGTAVLLREYANRIEDLGADADADLASEQPCIVNTELNAGNFIAPPAGTVNGRLKLVDWEKAVISARYQDLGHFLVPTTTLWKTNFRFGEAARRAFLAEYHAAAEPGVDLDTLDRRTLVLEAAIVLRALSWCTMAYVEYTDTDRELRNSDTFGTITSYLDRAESFIEEVLCRLR